VTRSTFPYHRARTNIGTGTKSGDSSRLSIYEAEILTKPAAPLDRVEQELRSLRAGNTTGMFLTIIEESADRTSHTEAPVDRQGHKDILDELNRLCRKLKRSAVTEEKIRTELSNLSEHAKTFVQVELALHQLQRPFDLASEDWSDPSLQIALEKSALDARRWVRQTPGGMPATRVHRFCRDVVLVYTQISGDPPGVGGTAYDPDYMTPFERLWHASLRLINPNATILEAREIFRRASGRR